MYISKIEIEGFGKWISQSFDLQSDLQVFYGENESGKSTLHAFIHAIFFGFAKKTESRNRYEPKVGAKYGGRVHVEDSKFGSAIIERLPGQKVSGKAKLLTDQGELDENFVNQVLYDTNLDLYTSIFSFDLDELNNIYQLKPEDLESQFLNLSVSGASAYTDQAGQFKKLANSIYKTGGRVPQLNVAIQDLKATQEALQLAENQNADYLKMKDRVSAIDQEVKEINQQLDQLSKKKADLSFLINNWERFDRHKWLTYQVNQDVTQVSADDQEAFIQLFEENQDLANQVDTLKQDLKNQQKSTNPSKELEEYLVNQGFYNQQFGRLKTLNDKLNRLNEADFKLKEKASSQDRLKDQLNMTFNQDLPKEISQEEVQKLTTLADQAKAVEGKIDKLDQDLNHLAYQEKVRADQGSQEVKNSQFSKFVPLITFLAVAAFAMSFNVSALWSLVIGGLAGISTLFFKNQTTSQVKDDTQEKADQATREGLLDQQKDLYQELDVYNENFQRFLADHQLPKNLSIDDVLAKWSFYNQVKANQEDLNRLKENKDKLVDDLTEETKDLEALSDLYPINHSPHHRIDNLNLFKDKVDKEMKDQEDYMKDLHHLAKQQEEKEDRLEIVENRIKQLTDKYEVQSVLDLKKMIEQNQNTKAYKEELNNLNDYLKDSPYLGEDLPDQSQVENQVNQVNASIGQLKEDKDQVFETKSDLNHQMTQLEQGRDYALILQEYENQVSNLEDLIESWLVARAGADLIDLTVRQGVLDQWPLIISQATDYFTRLTDGAYQEIRLDQGQIAVLSQNQVTYGVSDLSRGTAEPLYAAIRLAAIKLYAKEINLPILIDDGFVNMDAGRKAVIYDILEEISQKSQVIFFTFDPAVYSHFSDQHITKL